MKKTIIAFAGLSAIGLSTLSAQTTDSTGKVCYEGSSERWEDDLNGNITVETKFIQFAPTNSDAPNSFAGSFDLGYTGPAPVQNISSSFLSFTFDPAVTTVSLPGINVPDTIAVGDETWDLCHTCYDFNFDFRSEQSERFEVLVFDEKRQEIKPGKDGSYAITGAASYQIKNIASDDTIRPGSEFTVTIDNVEVCYCAVPEPSTASLGLLALLGLVARRKR